MKARRLGLALAAVAVAAVSCGGSERHGVPLLVVLASPELRVEVDATAG